MDEIRHEQQQHPHNLPHSHGQFLEDNTERIPNPDEFSAVSDLFRLLGDASRVRIFWILCHCEECVINLSAMMDMTSPAVSHHLKLLRASGLVISRREGKEVYYRASTTPASEALHKMIEQLVEVACPDGEGK